MLSRRPPQGRRSGVWILLCGGRAFSGVFGFAARGDEGGEAGARAAAAWDTWEVRGEAALEGGTLDSGGTMWARECVGAASPCVTLIALGEVVL